MNPMGETDKDISYKKPNLTDSTLTEDLEDLLETDSKINIELAETSMDLQSYFKPAKPQSTNNTQDIKKKILIDVLGADSNNLNNAVKKQTIPTPLKKPVFQSTQPLGIVDENDDDLDDEFETDAFEAISDEDNNLETKKFNCPSSILDLLQNADDIEPIISNDTNENSANDNLLNTRELDAKAIKQLLVIPDKNKEAWEEEEEKKQPEKDKKKAIVKKKLTGVMILIICILAIAGGGFAYFKFIIPASESNSVNNSVETTSQSELTIKSVEKLILDPNLKDKNKLAKYFDYAGKLYSKKEYKKVDILCHKLLPFRWHLREIYALLGKSNDKMGKTEKAIKYYKKALERDYHKDKELPLRLLTLLAKDKKYNEIINLRKYIKSYFSSNLQIQFLIAKAYYQLNDYKEAEEILSKFNIQFMDKEILLTYGKLLEINQNQTAAYKVYFLAGQNFNDINALKKALKYAPSNRARIDILTDLIAKTLRTEQSYKYKLALAEIKVQEGRKTEIYKTLASIDTNKLNEKDSLRYIKLMSESNNSFSVIHSCERLISSKFLENYEFQVQARDALLSNGKSMYAEKIFSNLLKDNPDNPVANYIYATISTDQKEKYKLLMKAFKLNPAFYQATISLGKLAYNKSDWKTAKKYFKIAVRTYAFKIEPKYWLILTEIRENHSPQSFLKFKNIVDNTKIPVKEKYSLLMALSHRYPTDKLAMQTLNEMKNIPELKQFYISQLIKTKLLYQTLTEKDFNNLPNENNIKKYRILFLLGKGKIDQVMNMPTTKKEFPEFWKVFICWRKNIKSWIKNSKLLAQKHPNNQAITISIQLWRRQITPEQAKSMLYLVKEEDRPLVCLMIAETFRRLSNKLKASVNYHMAIKYPQPNLYKNIAAYFKQH